MSKNTKTLLVLNPKDISERKGFNTRFDLGDLRELKASMELNGFDPAFPLIVAADTEKEGKFILGAQGHRRLTAALDAGLKEVYAILEDDSLTDEERNLDIIRLNSGQPLHLLEQARVVQRALAGEDVTQASVGKLLGKSAMHITNLVKLVSTTPQTQKWIEQDKIAATEVIDLVTELKDPEKVEAAVEKMIEKAAAKGKGKAKAKDKEPSDDDETEEEKEARLLEEKEAKEAVKARTKELQGFEKRVLKFIEQAQAADATVKASEEATDFDKALNNATFMLAAFLSGKEDLAGGAVSLADFWANVRGVRKAHMETVKTEVSTVKEEAKEKVAEVKEEAKAKVEAVKADAKESKEEAAKRIKAAKEAAKAKTPKA